MIKIKSFQLIIWLFATSNIIGQSGLRIEPPFWWKDMTYNELELLVYAKDINTTQLVIKDENVNLKEVFRTENPNYLFITVEIDSDAEDEFLIEFHQGRKKKYVYNYQIKNRINGSENRIGLKSSDVIYLLMPDRFANGNPDNDNREGMLEGLNRNKSLGRHGGDIQGIVDNLDYIANLGFTAIWPNPLLENNMPKESYHGYAITDLYKIDPRFGTNNDYLNLTKECNKRGMKVVMDMVFNHIGTNHYLVKDPPDKNWIHQWDTFTRTNYRGEVTIDPYSSDFDRKKMEKGWFDVTMADLNQSNPQVIRYLIQNSIWWIEYAGLNAIRMDTYPYPEKNAMQQWANAVLTEYPNFTIIGEVWLQYPAHVAYWQGGRKNFDGYDPLIPSVFDFPGYYAVNAAFNEKEGWHEGLMRLYYTLNQDFLYPDPKKLVVFADNHDVNRYFTSMQEDINRYKQGLVYYFTTRGIPQIYYGTEVLMTGKEHVSHGEIRKDFPGGWNGDSINAFTGHNLNSQQKEAQEFVRKMLQWRKTKPVIHNGKLKHFIPEEKTYVYFRYDDKDTIMVILNKNGEPYTLKLDRFKECLKGYSHGFEVLSGKNISSLDQIDLQPMTPMIIELK